VNTKSDIDRGTNPLRGMGAAVTDEVEAQLLCLD
jgi:hypothetical protein